MPVIGPDQPHFERDVVHPHKAGPRGRDEEVDIGALLVYVLDAVGGLIVLDTGTGGLGAPPGAAAAGEGRMRSRLAEDPAVESLLDAVSMQLGGAVGRLTSGDTIGRDLWQPRPKAGIHILF